MATEHLSHEWDSPMYLEAVAQFDRVAEFMNLDDNVADRLRVPQRSTVVTFPFRRDDYGRSRPSSAIASSISPPWDPPRAGSATTTT
jgi:hypothetical protein